ncbi:MULTISPECIES: hypothetical protein [Peptoniphilus]|uniref:hypothetical protein n=1 Tax=Peptoniphilus TaxID=162289 RepID=UPI000288E3C0|nr:MULTISPECIES: hypothetical protein [Peptoniphilus]MBS6610176.1 hypothetical protein [Peptoniphilus harei]MDU1043332.1 hypothetical protein [Peptoniphilus rhinitidis]MDU1954048.1 hypothetical protein [Peptoniphilus lacydonensis]MDU2109545.1 hypothetical protein [Peptoniphilus lacydonensis]MDU2115287.1 hypothetical protein [Peptoniphilus lacydonensis]
MKKNFIILISLFLVLGLVGCGNKNSKNQKTEDTKVSTTNKKEKDTMTTSNFDKEELDELIKNSDYISRIRIQTSTAEGMNTSFLIDYKGDLSKIVIDIPKTLSPNSEYIIFYRDDENGEVTPTTRDGSFIEIQGDKDSNLAYVEKVFNLNTHNNLDGDSILKENNKDK